MAITLIGTANVTGTATTRTLNCAAGGDWTTAPSLGDLMVVAVFYGDNSGFESFTPPAGWTAITPGLVSFDSVNSGGYQVYYRFTSASETTYTWTAGVNGQTGQLWIVEGFTLRGAANPVAFDPGFAFNANNADSLNQSAPARAVTAASTALIAGWAQSESTTPAVNYASVAAVNGVTSSTVNNAQITTPAGYAATVALWLAPGAGTWTPTATRGTSTAGQATWGSFAFGIQVASVVTSSPQRTLVGTGK